MTSIEHDGECLDIGKVVYTLKNAKRIVKNRPQNSIPVIFYSVHKENFFGARIFNDAAELRQIQGHTKSDDAYEITLCEWNRLKEDQTFFVKIALKPGIIVIGHMPPNKLVIVQVADGRIE
jgi:hypothetical protein